MRILPQTSGRNAPSPGRLAFLLILMLAVATGQFSFAAVADAAGMHGHSHSEHVLDSLDPDGHGPDGHVPDGHGPDGHVPGENNMAPAHCGASSCAQHCSARLAAGPEFDVSSSVLRLQATDLPLLRSLYLDSDPPVPRDGFSRT